MKYNRLGQSDLVVSEIAMGCMSLKNDQDTASHLIHQAIDLGINYFDTADLYDHGKNELLVGTALKEKRKEVIIATKVGNQWKADGSAWDWNPSKKYILSAVESSLKRLQTDYIDLYQLHGGTIDDPIAETIEAFELLKKQGKIRAYGISSIRPNVIREYAKRSTIASVMMQYSLLDRRPEETCLELLSDSGIAVVTRGTLAKGLLAGKVARSYLGHSEKEIRQAAAAVQKMATEKEISSSQLACQYVLKSSAVASAVIGFRTKEQLVDCVKAEALSTIDQTDYQFLQQAIPPTVYEKHR